ncbi:MAG: M23 family metallopeptidase [Candidatus Marinimicrobia bacterium]|nr:M23 family metallopeptidase [Candidatus Neomarinimicrobiota bacterium]
MENKNYTLYLISNHQEKPKALNFNSFHVWLLMSFFGALTLFLVVFLTLQFPRALKYKNLNAEYQQLIQDRLRLTKIVSDYNRIMDMDNYIRSVLGMDLALKGLDSTLADTSFDQLVDLKKNKSVNISYIDNIPAFPPVEGYVTQGYIDNQIFVEDNHYGIDIAAAEGEPIKAAAQGIVIFANWVNHLGNTIILYHGDGYFSIYGHNLRNTVHAHQKIERGEIIGYVGNTGISDGPHLHFEIWKEGIPLNPVDLIYSYQRADISTDNY